MSATGPRPPTLRLPPGFTANLAADPRAAACAAARDGADPATVFHAPLTAWCAAAIVLAPDAPLEILPVREIGGLALFDTLAALAPIRIPVRATAAFALCVNNAHAGGLMLDHTDAAPGSPPDWAVLSFRVAIDLRDPAPGDMPDETCLVEEGFAPDNLAREVLEGFCRHLMARFDAWREDGDSGLAAAWRDATAQPAPAR